MFLCLLQFEVVVPLFERGHLFLVGCHEVTFGVDHAIGVDDVGFIILGSLGGLVDYCARLGLLFLLEAENALISYTRELFLLLLHDVHEGLEFAH